MKRTRMIFDLPPDVQLAIRLAALKRNKTTSEIITEAVVATYPRDIEQAEQIIKERPDASEDRS